MRELRLFGALCVGARAFGSSLLLNGVLQKVGSAWERFARARSGTRWRRDLRTKEQDLRTKDRFRGRGKKGQNGCVAPGWKMSDGN